MVEKIKKYKRYKYRKVTPEIVKKAKALRKKKMSLREIGEKLGGIKGSTVRYHLNKEYREKTKKKARDKSRNLTKKQKRENNRKGYKKRKEQFNDRYNTDPKFRKYFSNLVNESFKRRRKNWIKKKVCSRCGKKRKNKRWKTCEKCRRENREEYRKRFK